MDESEVESVAQAAAQAENRVPHIASQAYQQFWPGWKRGGVHQRVLQQINPNNGANPLQHRIWLLILEDTGSDDMLDQVVEAHRIGKTKRAARESQRLELELERAMRVRSIKVPRSERSRRSA